MRTIILDGRRMTTKSEMHDHLMEQMNLPYYYARSLDSLWNILRKETDPIKIELIKADFIALGYGEVLVEMFHDLKEENENYVITVTR